MRAVRLVLFAGLLAALLAPTPARAEWFADIYGGRAFLRDVDVDATAASALGRVSATLAVDVDDSPVVGGRVGYWFPGRASWLGLALDVSTFAVEGEGIDIRAVPLSLLAMARLSLATDERFPHGRLQPYLAAGPSVAYYDAAIDLRPFRDETLEERAVGVGADLRAGLAALLAPRLALVAEYRVSRLSSEFEDEERLPLVGATAFGVEADLLSHQILVGLSARF